MKSTFKYPTSFVFLTMIGFLTLVGCKTKVIVEQPKEEYITKTSYDKKVSTINVPITISAKEIEKQINKYLTGILYEDRSFDNNGGDNLICVVKKYAPIKFGATKNLIRMTLPLDIKGSYTKLGAVVNFSGTLKANYSCKITLLDNWKVRTETTSNGYEWIVAPVADLGWMGISVGWLVDMIMENQNETINKSIDDAIKEYIDLKSLAQPAIASMAEPIHLSEEYKTWFKISPIEAQSTQILAKNDTLKLTLGLIANTETFIGNKPAFSELKNGVPLKVVRELPHNFNLGIVALLPYKEASDVLTEQFVTSGYEYVEGKYKLKFTAMSIYGQKDQLIIRVGMTGSVNGDIYLKGTPYYDVASRNIKMKNVDYDMDSKQKLLKTADWLAHGKLCKTMEKYMVYDIGAELDYAKAEALHYLTNYEPMKGVVINGELNKIETSDLYLVRDAIVAVFSVDGNLDVMIKDME